MMTEKELYSYLGKDILVIAIDGTVVQGFADGFTRAIDTDEGIAELDITTRYSHICVQANEVKSIKILTN